MARLIDRFELSSSSESKIGEHEQAVRCTEYSDSINALISGSWDATLKVWDLRANSCTSTHSLGNKVRRCISPTSARESDRERAILHAINHGADSRNATTTCSASPCRW